MEKKIPASQEDGAKRRRYSRVKIDCSAWLIINNTRQKCGRVCDLSMGGVCILSESSLEPGDMCVFELHESKQDSSKVYHYSARVAWKKADRFALEFVDIDSDSFFYLQTIVLYHAEDPLEVAEEFQEDFPCCR